MKIDKTLKGTELTLVLTGRLDTTTAPDLEAQLRASMDGISSLVMDFAALEYISSAGLRVLLSANKVMNEQGAMIIRYANKSVLEVFEVTGFTDIFTLK